MALDVQDMIREVLTNALQAGGEKAKSATNVATSNGGLSGMKGLAVGAGAAALAPIALKGAGKLARGLGAGGIGDAIPSPGEALSGAASSVGEKLTSTVKDKVDDAGGPGGIMKEAVKSALPFGGGDDDDDESNDGLPGVGNGRRMPVQQSVDIGLPVETVYNQFTQFEEWPRFMHRVTRVTQEDECTVSFATKIWGKTKEFTAKIETQRPDERIKWRVSEGMTHTGTVTFHEIGPNLTRVLLGFDVDPGSLLEKLARGARFVKRAARADLHRFKAFIEIAEHETGAWRGVIEDGELTEKHDASYDKKREYSDIEELTKQSESDDEGSNERKKSSSGQRKSGSSRSQSGRSSSGSSKSGGRRSQSSSSGQSRSRSASSRSGIRSSSGSRSGSSGRSRSSTRASSSRASSSRASSNGHSGGRSRSRSR